MLEIININKSYEGEPLLRNTSFTVGESEIVCLLGASGSGKSTLLRIIAGLETPESGQVKWDGLDLEHTPAYRREFGLMFQDYALFPFLDVTGNVEFGLRIQKYPLAEIKLRVDEVLQQVDLRRFGSRKVADLSGGEQQRVALARILAPRPKLLMFDEPLGALDRELRESLLMELKRILRQSCKPVIYVTHDQEEAFALADRILLLHAGQIVRSGTPEELWDRPGSAWAAKFLGLGNILSGRVISSGVVETNCGIFHSIACPHTHSAGAEVSILIRSDVSGASTGENSLQAVVREVTFTKNGYQVGMENDLVFLLPESPKIGELLTLPIPDKAIQCMG